jgi:hypothetical protein
MRDTELRFKPRNPDKYKGNPANIIYRSNLELTLMRYLDTSPAIIWWRSEEFFIPYFSPVDSKPHRYFPDFHVRLKDKDGKIKEVVIEIKPDIQTREPIKGNKKEKTYIREVIEWGRNQAKWEAAQRYCDNLGWEFQIVTEKDLGIPYKNGNKTRKR